MKHLSAAIALLALLGACQKSEPEQNNASAPPANAIAVPAAPPANPLPPTNANLRFVGTWAADSNLCSEGAWRFTERGLGTAGEVTCDFNRINPVPDGYDIAAMCRAAGEETRNTLRLRFTESAGTMAVEADRILQPVSLIYCGAGPN